jgi:hypothetical protein
MRASLNLRTGLAHWTNTERVKCSRIEVVDDRLVEQSGSPQSGPRRERRGPRSRAGHPFASELKTGRRGHHWRPACMDGRDDLLDVNPLQVDAGRAEVGVTELALDDVHRHALSGELYRMRVAQLVRREAAPDARLGCMPAKLGADRGS